MTPSTWALLSEFFSLVPMLKEFFHALQTDTPVPITGEDGLWAVELAEACYQAAQTGQPISVT